MYEGAVTSTRHIMTSSTELVFRVGGHVSLELTVPPHASGGWVSYRYLSTVSLIGFSALEGVLFLT